MGREHRTQLLLQNLENEAVFEAMVAQGLWQSADGNVMRICDMTTSHLENTLGWLRKKDYYCREEYLKLFSEALQDRVDDEFTAI